MHIISRKIQMRIYILRLRLLIHFGLYLIQFSGTDFGVLPDINYFSSWGYLYDFVDVTHKASFHAKVVVSSIISKLKLFRFR